MTGEGSACGLSQGTVKCWGYRQGELAGAGERDSPVPLIVPGLGSAPTKISAGSYHTCAITSAGALMCWGDNNNGRLGDGTGTKRPVPVQVLGLSSGVVDVSAGGSHTCAILTGGTMKCWGYGFGGQLGQGQSASSSRPVDVVGISGATAVSAGDDMTCAITGGGRLQCWGGGQGRLGNGSAQASLTPVDVPAFGSGTRAVSLGYHHACALTAAGAVSCWGRNQEGQLGDGTTSDRLSPTPVSGLSSGVKSVAAGTYRSCAVTAADTVQCWGAGFGATPVTVGGLSSVTSLDAGGGFLCAIAGGVFKCAGGSNSAGELGDGTRNPSSSPVNVLW